MPDLVPTSLQEFRSASRRLLEIRGRGGLRSPAVDVALSVGAFVVNVAATAGLAVVPAVGGDLGSAAVGSVASAGIMSLTVAWRRLVPFGAVTHREVARLSASDIASEVPVLVSVGDVRRAAQALRRDGLVPREVFTRLGMPPVDAPHLNASVLVSGPAGFGMDVGLVVSRTVDTLAKAGIPARCAGRDSVESA